MAAGRHGGYRENEFRVREPDPEVSRRKDYSQDRPSEGDRGRSRSRGIWDRTDRGSIGGSQQSPLSSNSGGIGGSGQKMSRLSSSVDREPGELSSGSESEGPEMRDTRRADEALQKEENGDLAETSKKRKFSPIIWDLDERKRPDVANSRRNSEPVEPVVLPLPPSLPRRYFPSGIVRQPPEQASSSDIKEYTKSPRDQQIRDDREPGQLDEDYSPAPNISTSRWADGNGAIEDDEAEAEIEEIMPKRKSKSLPSSVDRKLQKKVPSPEITQVWREGSVGAGSMSSDSVGEHREGSREIEADKKDCMDVDSEQADEDETDHDTDSEDSKGSVRTPEPVNPPQRSINMLQGCRSVDEFERLNKIDEGTYGIVYRARDKKGGEIVALKKVKMEKEREGFPLTSLREINILLSFHHPSVVDVKEVVVGSSLDSIFMVMEYMEHDLKGLMETMKQAFSQSEVKCLMLQLLEGVKYLHDNWVLHRDLKTSNLLLNNRGELKICDFGLSRQYGSPLKPYTHLVVTLWYRAPELLLGAKEYSTAIDMWSLGCIMAELLAKEPLFSGKTEFDQLDKIFRTLGTPNEKIWPGFSKLPGVKVNFVKQSYNKLREKFPPTSFSGRPTLSEAGFDLLNKLLTYDPDKRITAEAALKHDWFCEVPLPKSKDFMPTFPAQHAQDRRLRRMLKSPDPLEEQRRKELQQGDLGAGSLFG